jgi:hypothetical protein
VHDPNALFLLRSSRLQTLTAQAKGRSKGRDKGKGKGLLTLALWGYTSLLGGFKGVLRPHPSALRC